VTVELSRRTLLKASLVAGGGLVIGFTARPRPAAAAAEPTPDPDAFIRIAGDGRITLVVPYAEMGQGAYTSQAQILADELEVELAAVTVVPAPPDERRYASPLFGGQITGGSGSLRGSWITLRTAGAAARTMLIAAAAAQWKVRPATCRAERGRVLHAATGRALEYRELADAAARLPVPAAPVLKQRKDYRLIGTAVKRIDTPEKINGTAVFGIDVRPPGVRYAVVRACPIIGGTVARVDPARALAVAGVRQVVQIADAVAVVADHTWAARKGLAALDLTWDDAGNGALATADLVAAADAALDGAATVAVKTGDVDRALAGAARRFEAVFRLPMLAHAAMEPLSCTVHVTPTSCEVWLGSQVLGRAHKTAAEVCGLPLDKVTVHNHLLGGGFGRRLEFDYVTQAVALAKQVEGPVKITWTREEDMQHDYFRYHNHSRVTVGVDAGGAPVAWHHRVVGPNIMKRFLPIYQSKDGVDLDLVDGAAGAYALPAVLVDVVANEAPRGLATGNWRGVGPTRNAYIVESVIDQLAHDAGKDPIAYRRPLLGAAPRLRAALDLVAAKSGWGTPLGPRQGRGVAVLSGFESHLAMVAEVSVAPDGEIRVTRVVCAIDCGVAVNPDIVRAQLEGGVNFGISAVLWGRITVARGRIEQRNFNDYRLLRIHEAPVIEVHVIPSDAEPGGVGEPGTSGAIAAVANAVFAATGKRALSLPIDPALVKEA
jgi:isoquinoline 1-oxidoreductase beta subunit